MQRRRLQNYFCFIVYDMAMKAVGAAALASILAVVGAAAYHRYKSATEEEDEKKLRRKSPAPRPAGAKPDAKLPYLDVAVDTSTARNTEVSLIQACVAIYGPWKNVKPVNSSALRPWS